MSSSTSLKDLTKAINSYIAEPTLPLPDDLIASIADYLGDHQKYDEAAADRLQEELVSIFEKHVKGDAAATGTWIAILRRLIPVLQTPDRILYWFEFFRGILDHPTNQRKLLIDEAIAGMIDLAKHSDEYHGVYGAEATTVSPFIERLLKVWMTRIYPAHVEGAASIEYTERMTREGLIQFGKKRTKELFICIDGYFVKKQYRRPALRILCDFLQSQPPHLYHIMQTPLFGNLLHCLQIDTSTSVISAALTALIMLFPHMPSSLVPHLPILFNIYARLLFWNRERSGMETPSVGADQAGTWEACGFDSEDDDWSIAQLSNYYTMLYGLYPINFMDYIRKPQRYLRHANVSNSEAIEIQPTEIRDQSERFRRNHLLHPNFYSLTIDSEKTDFGRWIKSEAAEVMGDCMALCLAPEHGTYDGHEVPLASGARASSATDGDKDGPDPALLSSSVSRIDSWRNLHSFSAESVSSHRPSSTLMRQSSHSSHPSNRDSSDVNGERMRDPSMESPTLSPQLTVSSSQTQLQDLLQSNKAIKSGLHHSLTSDSLPSLALSQQDSGGEKPAAHASAPALVTSPMSNTPSGTQVLHLQRQILLLQNDLSFERYLKQQHMAHIGELRRRHVVEAATEAEMQNLIMMNRSLKNRFEEAKKAEMQVRKESEKSRAMAKKWEADLANKLKHLRDESKKMKTEFETTQRELDDSTREVGKLRRLVCDGEVKELNYQQNMQSINLQMPEMDRLKAEVERLESLDLDHQAKEVERRAAMESTIEAQSQLEALNLKLTAQENEIQRTKRLFQSQIAVLQDRLSEALEKGERTGPVTNTAVESALAGSRAKQAEMQKQYSLLMRKYTTLQSSLLDMQTGATSAQLTAEEVGSQEHETDGTPRLEALYAVSTDSTRLSSTPDIPDSSTFTVKPALSREASALEGSARPLTPPATKSAGSGTTGTSPEQRYFGRGGVQNRLRKDGKERSKEESTAATAAAVAVAFGAPGPSSSSSAPSNKKEKKSSGLRGYRGLIG